MQATSRLQIYSAIALLGCLVVSMVVVARVRDSYRRFVAVQTAAYQRANMQFKKSVAVFSRDHQVIVIGAVNTTGGTMHLYLGEPGQMRNVSSDVQVDAGPMEVATVAPHGSTRVNVYGWSSKYVTASTTYLFLGSASRNASRLLDLDFVEEKKRTGNPVALYFAPANASDSNYTSPPQYELALADHGLIRVRGSELVQQQMQEIATFSRAIAPKHDDFPTSFGAYLRALSPKL
jgi:hypothetical protein